MIGVDPWKTAIPEPIWWMPRITREERKLLSTVNIDGAYLSELAADQQAIFVECSASRAASLLCAAVRSINYGTVWVIAANSIGYESVCQKAQLSIATNEWKTNHLMRDVDPDFGNVARWADRGCTLLLEEIYRLRHKSPANLRRRQDILTSFVPFIAIIDPDLLMCNLRGTWDPAWVVRDLVARLCTKQPAVPIVIFTERESISVGTARAYATFGISGMIFVDGRS